MTVTEALEQIKSILEECPIALSQMQPFIKELRKEFRDKGQYYGHGGARVRCNSSKESSSSKLNLNSNDSKNQQIKTKLETADGSDAVLEGILNHELFSEFDTRKPSYKEFSFAYRMYCGRINITFDKIKCDELWEYYLSTWED